MCLSTIVEPVLSINPYRTRITERRHEKYR